MSDPSEEHQLFRETCRQFAMREIAPLVEEAETSGRYPVGLRKRAAEAGLLGLDVPEKFGGAGAGFSFSCIATEEFSRVCAGLATGIMTGLGEGLLVEIASPEQQERYLVPTIRGELSGCFAMTEPDAGSDVLAMKGRATRVTDGWHIRAHKMYTTGAPFSDYMLVVVYTEPDARQKGLSIFIVDSNSPGIEMQTLEKLGHHSMETAAVFYDCVVPPNALLGEEGSGIRHVMSTLERGRVVHAARSLGVARAACEAAVEYARERKTFGSELREHQSIQFRLARMQVELKSAELHVAEAAQKIERGERALLEACMAKLVASEAAVSISDAAMQIHAGAAYINESAVQRYFRDARLYPISEGTNEIQLRAIAREARI